MDFAKNNAERFLAALATQAAQGLVADGKILIWPEGRSDKYKRPLVRVTVNSEDWAGTMIDHGLAVQWEGKRHDWCGTVSAFGN